MNNLNRTQFYLPQEESIKSHNILLLIYGLILFLAFDLSGQDMTAKFDSILQEAIVASDGPGYSVLISKEGKTIYRKNIGFADLENSVRIQSDHIFQIASVTKQFTSIGILRLVERGLISLDDDIRKYVPSFPSSESVVTIHHLLAHTSGIPNHSKIPGFDERFSNFTTISPIQIINEFKDEEVEFLSGEKASYNNFGYDVLGHIIEEVSQMSFGEYLNQEFFIPLNLNNTSYVSEAQSKESYVKGYKRDGQKYSQVESVNLQLAFAAGGITSTVEDITKWYSYINRLRLANDPIIQLALTAKTTNQNLATGYGYGWQIGTYKGRDYYGHDGVIRGFNCDTRFYKGDEIFITVFSNLGGNGSVRILRKLSHALMPSHIDMVEDNSNIQLSCEKFSGRYQLRPDFTIEISTLDQKIYGSPNGQGKVELKPIGINKFYVQEIEAEIEFVLDQEGAYNSFTLVQGGQENIALRLEP